MARVRFVSPTFYDGVSYAQNQVVDLSDDAVKALGDSVERADDVNVEETAEKLADQTADPDTRAELDVHHEPGDAQDVPDALRDEAANLKQGEEAVSPSRDANVTVDLLRVNPKTDKKSVDKPTENKMVNRAPTKK
jgi:hypothetical protein